ncbi:MAG TPA: glycosyltransferase, partial [Sphingomicrobium sp.]|nr:glycosyltransferase [Sphingomicrobium sp.]
WLNDAQDAGRSRRAQMRKALFAYRKHSRAWRPDIMVSAGNHGHLLSSFAWLGLPGIKVLRFSNDLTHGSPSAITRLWRAARFRLMALLADRLVYVSRAQGRHPLLAGQLSAGKALIIPNGVDLNFVRRGAAQHCDHPWARDWSIPIVLAVGRHVRQKNFATLLKAFANARAERPMRLIFLGDGQPAEISDLKKLAVQLQVAGDVDFVPAVQNPFCYMAAARTFALPSLWEGSANVLLEAMACGTPVIGSRTAGDAEHILESGKHGVVVDPRDVEQMAAALLRQTGPVPVRPGMRAAAFSRNAAMRQYIRLFDVLTDRDNDAAAQAVEVPSAAVTARV